MISSPASRGATASVTGAGRACLAAASPVSAENSAMAASATIAGTRLLRLVTMICAVMNRLTMPCPGRPPVRTRLDQIDHQPSRLIPTPLQRFPVILDQEVIQYDREAPSILVSGAYPCRRTGSHFAGTCAGEAAVGPNSDVRNMASSRHELSDMRCSVILQIV